MLLLRLTQQQVVNQIPGFQVVALEMAQVRVLPEVYLEVNEHCFGSCEV